jgi:hypothetical protein
METILHDLLLPIDADEDARQAIGRLTDLDLRLVLIDDDPTERLGPPAAESEGVGRIDDDLFSGQ